MQLPTNLHKRLVEEFAAAAEGVEKAASIPEKLYHFSVFFGEASRLLNQAWEPELVLIHNTTQNTHRLVNGRLMSLAAGADIGVALPDGIDDWLAKSSHELAGWVRDENRTDAGLVEVLSRLSAIGYSTTGNGYYLYLRGQLKVY